MAPVAKANRAGIVPSADGPLCGRTRPTSIGNGSCGSNAGLWRATPSVNWPHQSGYSPRTLHRIIAHWLQQPPPLACEFSAARHLILDGTFLDHRERRVCGDGCGPLRCGIMRLPKWRKAPRHFATVLHDPGPLRINSSQCDRRWQPALAPDLAPGVADDRHSTLSSLYPTARPQFGVASRPNARTPGTCAPCFARSWRSTLWPSGISLSLRCRRGSTGTGSA